jgi:hypothetical protein
MTKSQIPIVEHVKSLIKKKTSICIHGDSGVGKTFLASHIFKDEKVINMSYELLKTNFENAKSHILVDDLQEVTDIIKSRGSFMILSRVPLEWCQHNVHIKELPSDEIYEISKKYFEFDDADHLIKGGNLNSVLNDFEFCTDVHRDNFLSQKDLILDMVKNPKNAWSQIGRPFCEHGYSVGIIHENYTDHGQLEIADCLSLADVQDVRMYQNQHDSAGMLFSFFGIIQPAILLGKTKLDSMNRPGSVWTKYNNYKMRHKKYTSMKNMDIDSLIVVNQYCKKSIKTGADIMKSYGLTAADADVMNHIVNLRPETKMKTKVLQALKTELKS